MAIADHLYEKALEQEARVNAQAEIDARRMLKALMWLVEVFENFDEVEGYTNHNEKQDAMANAKAVLSDHWRQK